MPETLILIGVADPAPLLARTFRNALVVEPDPARASELAANVEDMAEVEAIEAALSDRTENVPLIVYNQPGLRGLRPPSAHLQRLFPGLRERARHEVRRIGAVELFQMAGQPEFPIRLWLDTGGEEVESLAALEAADLLDKVVRITLRCGVEPLFEGALAAGDLIGWLQNRGFVLGSRDDGDPDWPVLDFVRSPLFWALRDSTARGERLDTENQALKDRVTDLQRQLTERTDRVKALAAEQKDVLAAREEATTQVANLQALVEELTSERDEAKGAQAELADKVKQIAELEEARDRSRAQVVDLQRQLTERTDRVKALAAEQKDVLAAREEATTQVANLQALVEELTSERDEARGTKAELADKVKQIAELEEADASMRGDLAVALRMQSVAQSDLRELQMRYRVADADRHRQSELLKALTPRLQQAAARLQLLTQSDHVSAEQLVQAAPETDATEPQLRNKPPRSSKPRSKGKAGGRS